MSSPFNSVTAWHRTPPEIWSYIQDLAAAPPPCAEIDRALDINPDDYFEADMRQSWNVIIDSALEMSVRCRISIAQVCGGWRKANLEKAYECLHVQRFNQLTPLGNILEQSCSRSCPAGYGGRTKQFSWRLPSVRGGQYPPEVVRSLVKILHYLPNLLIFAPSPHAGATKVPTEVMDVLSETGISHTLRCLRIVGSVELLDLRKFFADCPALTSVSLGNPGTPLEHVSLLCTSLPSLRSLHIELNHLHSSQYIRQFTSALLPCLEEIYVLFRHHDDGGLLDSLLAAHGKKIKLLRLEMATSYFRRQLQLTFIVTHCPQMTDLIYELDWFEDLKELEIDIPLRRLGLLVLNLMSHVDTDEILKRFARLRSSSLPKTLQSVRMLDIAIVDLPNMGDATDALHHYLSSWSVEWRGEGIRLEDMNGEVFGGPNDIA